MSEWHAWMAAWTAWGLNAVGIVGAWLTAIWTDDDRLGYTGVLMLGVAVVSGIGLGCWSAEAPRRPLPRKERKALKREKARIELEQRIRELEREAGL